MPIQIPDKLNEYLLHFNINAEWIIVPNCKIWDYTLSYNVYKNGWHYKVELGQTNRCLVITSRQVVR